MAGYGGVKRGGVNERGRAGERASGQEKAPRSGAMARGGLGEGQARGAQQRQHNARGMDHLCAVSVRAAHIHRNREGESVGQARARANRYGFAGQTELFNECRSARVS